MKVWGIVALSALVLSGCVSQPDQEGPKTPNGIALLTPMNSMERLRECAMTYDSKDHSTSDYPDCWAGKKPTHKELCAAGNAYLNHDFASDWQKAAMYEKMRNNGCMR